MKNNKVKNSDSPDAGKPGINIDIPNYPADDGMFYYAPQYLESLRSKKLYGQPAKDYAPRRSFEHLRDVVFDLNSFKLTDKQLIAVSLVFYGRVNRRRVAKIMKITEQSLQNHVKAALRKIEKSLCGL